MTIKIRIILVFHNKQEHFVASTESQTQLAQQADAIARMERAAEKGKAIAAAVEGVEKQWGTSKSG